ADPKRQLFLYAAAGDWMTPHDHEVLQDLLEWIARDELGAPAQVLLRLHPKYTSATEAAARGPHLIVDRPGVYQEEGTFLHWEFEDADVRHLANSLAHSAVVVNTASTLSIEAAFFDRPIVLIGYDGKQQIPSRDSVARFYQRDHYQRIVVSGGATLVVSAEAFRETIRAYLKNPSQDAAGRARIVSEQCWRVDGQAGHRVAATLISHLSKSGGPRS
ncbi:hypothetical protein KBD18_01605, partial [Patescibacteria group bacterium]|nr:hypothetical protein [Patescibacteria group bacterium]